MCSSDLFPSHDTGCRDHPGEREFILPRRRVYRVKGVREEQTYRGDKYKVVSVDLVIITKIRYL